MTVKSWVLHFLEHLPFTRNNDKRLMAYVWAKMFPETFFQAPNGRWAMYVDDFIEKLPDPEAIRRQRANIQNDKGLFPPTDPEVIKKRHQREENWRKEILEI